MSTRQFWPVFCEKHRDIAAKGVAERIRDKPWVHSVCWGQWNEHPERGYCILVYHHKDVPVAEKLDTFLGVVVCYLATARKTA